MATAAEFAHGTLLKLGNGGAPETFATIAEVSDLKPPQIHQEALEATSHDSTDGWKEFVGGLLDAGEVTLTVNFLPTHATHSYSAGLIKDAVNRTKRNFQLVFPDAGGTTWTFAALVTAFEPNAPVDGLLTADVTLTISGKPTLA